MTARLLLIDDDARLAAMVGDYLRAAGLEIETAGTLAAGRERLASTSFDAKIIGIASDVAAALEIGRASCRERVYSSV